jgi:hypothetical protein
MRVGRRLQRLGALPVAAGTYALPHTRRTRDDLERLRADIVRRKGTAALFAADPVDAGAAADLAARFRAAREIDFAALRREARALDRHVPAARVRQLAERLARLQSIDFFGSPAAAAAARAVAAAIRRAACGRRRSG